MAWECEGKRLDKTLSAFGQHPRRNIIGDECPECNLSKAEVPGSTTIIGQPRRKLSPLYAIPVVLGIGGIAWANLTKPNSPPTDPVPTNPPPSTTQSQCPFPGCKLTIGSPAAPSSSSSSSANSSGSNEDSTCAEAKLFQASTSSAKSSSSESKLQPRNRKKLRQYLEEEFKKQHPSIKLGIRGSKARLIVDRDLCRACGQNGGVRGMARQLDIEELEVISPSGYQLISLK